MAGAQWQFENGGLAAGNVGNAPTYDDITYDFMGQKYFQPGKYDPALAMTLNAGNQGGWKTGLDAFLNHGTDDSGDPMMNMAATGYKSQDLKDLAAQFGIDPNSADLQQQLTDRTKNYSVISGLSGGWNASSDPRQANGTLYESRDGKLVPIQTGGYSAPTQGSWLAENKGILAPLAVIGGGLAYGALAGAGAGTAGGAAAGGTAGAGTAGSVGAGGAGAVGTGGAGATGLSGSIANALGVGGWWGGLPAWGQGAITGALQGGVTSGLQGQNPIKGALMGGLTGGVGSYAGGALSAATGLPSWASRGLVSAGLGGLSGGWQGALGAGLGSLATTGLGEAGVPGELAGRLGGFAGRTAAGAISGGSSSGAGGSGGGSGGVGMGGGVLSGSGSAATGAGGGLGGWRLPSAADAATASYLKQSYAPIAIEAQRKKLAQDLLDEAA